MTQCSALRGLAIIGIFLHNYCHWLGLAVKENEYTFTIDKCRRLLEVMTHPDINLPVHLLSFFGHYGVPVFLFLSAYGLVMKYEGGTANGGTANGGTANGETVNGDQPHHPSPSCVIITSNCLR